LDKESSARLVTRVFVAGVAASQRSSTRGVLVSTSAAAMVKAADMTVTSCPLRGSASAAAADGLVLSVLHGVKPAQLSPSLTALGFTAQAAEVYERVVAAELPAREVAVNEIRATERAQARLKDVVSLLHRAVPVNCSMSEALLPDAWLVLIMVSEHMVGYASRRRAEDPVCTVDMAVHKPKVIDEVSRAAYLRVFGTVLKGFPVDLAGMGVFLGVVQGHVEMVNSDGLPIESTLAWLT